MKNFNKILLLISIIAFVVTVFTQCASQQSATSSTDNASKGTPEYVLQKSGAQLWAESCIRCHNTASPATFSDVQWDVAVKHMEIRAQLTRVEAEKILEFIQSAN
ncbi:hypothetical protein [Ekhidna sp.]|uniref:hypothetical protein n=1 Tax=Ekhidna sp. TaxID=2608089 RepID=UPI003C7DDA54